MAEAQNSMRRDWTYAGRELWTTVQWDSGSPINATTFYILISIKAETDQDMTVREAVISDPANLDELFLEIGEGEGYARQYVDELQPDPIKRRLEGEHYTDSTLPEDTTDFREFTEFGA